MTQLEIFAVLATTQGGRGQAANATDVDVAAFAEIFDASTQQAPTDGPPQQGTSQEGETGDQDRADPSVETAPLNLTEDDIAATQSEINQPLEGFIEGLTRARAPLDHEVAALAGHDRQSALPISQIVIAGTTGQPAKSSALLEMQPVAPALVKLQQQDATETIQHSNVRIGPTQSPETTAPKQPLSGVLTSNQTHAETIGKTSKDVNRPPDRLGSTPRNNAEQGQTLTAARVANLMEQLPDSEPRAKVEGAAKATHPIASVTQPKTDIAVNHVDKSGREIGAASEPLKVGQPGQAEAIARSQTFADIPQRDANGRNSELKPISREISPYSYSHQPQNLNRIPSIDQTPLPIASQRLAEMMLNQRLDGGETVARVDSVIVPMERTNAQSASFAATPPPGQARHVAQQLVQAMPTTVPGTTEILLQPEELGRVRMTLTVQDGALALVIAADRPETTDLMRRHLDQLVQSYRQMGFDTLSFSFSGSSHQSFDDTTPSLIGSTDTEQMPADDSPAGITQSLSSTRLDMRI